MILRLMFVPVLLAPALAFAADGLPPRDAAADYPAHVTASRVEIGAAYVPAAQVKKLFGEDLEKRGFVTFEIGLFPQGSGQIDVSPDDFKLRQGKDQSVERAASPDLISRTIHPPKSSQPKLPSNVQVHGTEAVVLQTGPNGGHVYTASQVGVGIGKDPNGPPPPPPSSANTDLQQQLEDKALPETKTARPVAGYVFFPKPDGGKNAPFELLYFGPDGQVNLTLPAVAKP